MSLSHLVKVRKKDVFYLYMLKSEMIKCNGQGDHKRRKISVAEMPALSSEPGWQITAVN